ncbi:hypothetical protein GCM10023322_45730 [Rugosimonospora acidiphila]|uniref:Uncharacterized protein n=1 Tax=Rugosimonospora acidiphila TaxID=556531 RepID=A0ABP9S4M9_9ACTN
MGDIAVASGREAAPEAAQPLDYYLVLAEGGPAARPDGLVVEEFVLAEDHSALALASAGWGPSDDRWWSSAALSRTMRTDPELRARVVPVDRDDAGDVYRRLGGGELPDEETLRTHFSDQARLADSAPLWLGTEAPPDGYREKRVYRVLFAKELTAPRLADLSALWGLEPAGDVRDPGTRVVGTARRARDGDLFTWDLRRIGEDIAWCLDVTAYLATGPGHSIGHLLSELRAAMRRQGLIPVTIERFA